MRHMKQKIDFTTRQYWTAAVGCMHRDDALFSRVGNDAAAATIAPRGFVHALASTPEWTSYRMSLFRIIIAENESRTRGTSDGVSRTQKMHRRRVASKASARADDERKLKSCLVISAADLGLNFAVGEAGVIPGNIVCSSP